MRQIIWNWIKYVKLRCKLACFNICNLYPKFQIHIKPRYDATITLCPNIYLLYVTHFSYVYVKLKTYYDAHPNRASPERTFEKSTFLIKISSCCWMLKGCGCSLLHLLFLRRLCYYNTPPHFTEVGTFLLGMKHLRLRWKSTPANTM